MLTEIIEEIALISDDWRTVIRMAGTCREVRECLLRTPLVNAQFVARSVLHATEVLVVYKFVKLDLLSLFESKKSRKLGEIIVGNFDMAPEHAKLTTSSVLITDQIVRMRAQCGPCYGYLHYYLKYEREAEPNGRRELDILSANQADPNVFNCFREVMLDASKIVDNTAADFVRNMSYRVNSSTCPVINFVNYTRNIAPAKTHRLTRIIKSYVYMYPICEELEVYNSEVVIHGPYFPNVRSLRVYGSSKVVLPDYFNLVFPNATLWCECEQSVKCVDAAKLNIFAGVQVGDMTKNFADCIMASPKFVDGKLIPLRKPCFGANVVPNMKEIRPYNYSIIDINPEDDSKDVSPESSGVATSECQCIECFRMGATTHKE